MAKPVNLAVDIRLRPSLQFDYSRYNCAFQVKPQNQLKFKVGDESFNYQFTNCYDLQSSNDEVYQKSVRPLISNALYGFNGALIAYGPNNSGKTYTIFGKNASNADQEINEKIRSDQTSRRNKLSSSISPLRQTNRSRTPPPARLQVQSENIEGMVILALNDL